MNYKIKSNLKNLSFVFQSYPSIKTVYFFGSYTRGKEVPNSDMDFALLLSDNHDIEDRAFLAYELEKKMEFISPVDIIILNHQNLLFKFNVVKEGKIIYEVDRNFRVRFETRLLTEYHEIEPHLEFFEYFRIQGVLKRLGIYETT